MEKSKRWRIEIMESVMDESSTEESDAENESTE